MPESGRQYNYSVDGKQYHSAEKDLSGAEIKRRAGVGPNFGLFLEGKGNAADRPIADGDIVDVSLPGHERFYTAPPATFGGPV